MYKIKLLQCGDFFWIIYNYKNKKQKKKRNKKGLKMVAPKLNAGAICVTTYIRF